MIIFGKNEITSTLNSAKNPIKIQTPTDEKSIGIGQSLNIAVIRTGKMIGNKASA